jgi:hypothetical protein
MAIAVVVVLAWVVVVMCDRTGCEASVRLTAAEQLVHANTTTSTTAPRAILTLGS